LTLRLTFYYILLFQKYTFFPYLTPAAKAAHVILGGIALQSIWYLAIAALLIKSWSVVENQSQQEERVA